LADDGSDLIRRVKEANDIVDVIGAYVSLRQVGAKYKGLCPFHDDSRPSMDVDPRWQNFRCWACGKHGDVITFVQEQDRVSFREALEMLAQRAGISLEKKGNSQPNSSRALMIEVIRWSEEQYQKCFLDDPLADAARLYVGERRLTGETVRKFGLGYAPVAGDWLLERARQANISLELLEQVGLIAQRKEGQGYYDRFRDRVMFPIRDARGRTVGFGGRILPSSPLSARAPKYYNSCDTPLFNKSELLYGLDQARQTAADLGYLAVVEGYTDVLMAHQFGVTEVVATMGTALNERHVRHVQRLVPRVVLVFDADAGGSTGVDRALEIFVRQDVALQIATLPQGLDPFDLLVQQGADAFRSALTNSQDVLEFKLNEEMKQQDANSLEGRRRAADEVLRVIAQAFTPQGADEVNQAAARGEILSYALRMKRELMITRIGQRFGFKEETVWARLRELEAEQRKEANPAREDSKATTESTAKRQAPAPAHERELLELLLCEPRLVAEARREIDPGRVSHPGLRQLLDGLYRLFAEGVAPTLDQLRTRVDNPPLIAKAFDLRERGLGVTDRQSWWHDLLVRLRERELREKIQEIQSRLQATDDRTTTVELLRQLQSLQQQLNNPKSG
jgi:DNA primase